MRSWSGSRCLGGRGWGAYLILLFAVMASGVIGGAAEATTIAHLTLDGLVGGAGVVIEGTVAAIEYQYGDEDNIPTTTYHICAVEAIVGAPPRGAGPKSCFAIEVPGGPSPDGGGGGYAGMPELQEGARYVLFLRPSDQYTSPFVGWWQGVYQVVEGPTGLAVLSNAGFPVEGLDATGAVKTKRNVRYVPLRDGVAEQFVGGPQRVDTYTAAGEAISRGAFLDMIQMAVLARQFAGSPIPTALPAQWRCRRSRRFETGQVQHIPQTTEVLK